MTRRLLLALAAFVTLTGSAFAQVNLPPFPPVIITPAPYITGDGIPLGPIVGATGCTAPPYTFTGSLTTGLCSPAAGAVSLEAAGTEVTRATTAGLDIGPLPLTFGSAIGTPYGFLKGQAANILQLAADATHAVGLSMATDAQLQCLTRAGADGCTLKANTVNNSGSTIGLRGVTYTLPSADGAGALTSNGSAALSWTAVSAGAMTLVAEIEGTTTTAIAENIALASISGLTVKDTLYVVGTLESVTAATASAFLYNSTDSKNLSEVDGSGAINAGMTIPFTTVLAVAQSATTLVTASTSDGRVTADDTTTNGAVHSYRNPVTTAWTGSWNLALRQGGVTVTGTLKYRIKVFKIVGQ